MNNTNDIFNHDFSRQYDATNARLAAINNNLHLLISLLLNELPQKAHILCVGVGTGTEILSLAQRYPEWHFTGIDPSPDMLSVCAEKLQLAGVAERCQLYPGYLADLPVAGDYHAVLCLLVAHFIQHPQRDGLYQQIARQLAPQGRVILAEIAGDMLSPEFDHSLTLWARMHEVLSQSARDPQEIKAQFAERLLLLPPAHTESLLTEAGFDTPCRFFQSLLIHGWTALKADQDRMDR